MEALRGAPCGACGEAHDEHAMVLCDRCETPYHKVCGEDGGRNPVHAGPWYCAACRGRIMEHGYSDVIEDLGLIAWLW